MSDNPLLYHRSVQEVEVVAPELEVTDVSLSTASVAVGDNIVISVRFGVAAGSTANAYDCTVRDSGPVESAYEIVSATVEPAAGGAATSVTPTSAANLATFPIADALVALGAADSILKITVRVLNTAPALFQPSISIAYVLWLRVRVLARRSPHHWVGGPNLACAVALPALQLRLRPWRTVRHTELHQRRAHIGPCGPGHDHL